MDNLEVINGNTSFAFSGARTDIWHRLGQQFDGGLMTADEAMRLSNMDRTLQFVPVTPPEGLRFANTAQFTDQWYAVLDGKIAVDDDGKILEIEPKIVGRGGEQFKAGHESLTVRDRFLLAEAAIHVSEGQAVWSTAGLLRDGTQGFATMESPPIVIDPFGVADVIRNYMTIKWAFDSSFQTELGGSNIRVVCANTLAAHDGAKRSIIKVKMTRGASERFQLAADHWAMAQNEVQALKLKGERMIRMAEGQGRKALVGLAENVLGINPKTAETKRAKTIQQNKLDELVALYYAPTNSVAVGDNAWAAAQTVTEWFDWFSPVKGEDALTERVANQFDEVHVGIKQKVDAYLDEVYAPF